LERNALPWLKDPKAKVSFFSIIKENIGKELSRISVPVYFNDPTSLLQKCCASMEYNYLLDNASDEPNPIRRMGLVMCNAIA